MGLKIIVHSHLSQAEEHAKEWFTVRRRQQMKHPNVNDVDLHGISQYSVRYPNICDDCGQTFWANDPYAEHARCPKGRSKMGF